MAIPGLTFVYHVVLNNHTRKLDFLRRVRRDGHALTIFPISYACCNALHSLLSLIPGHCFLLPHFPALSSLPSFLLSSLCSLLPAPCSLLPTLCSLLSAQCSRSFLSQELLSAICSLLSAHCSLLSALLLMTTGNGTALCSLLSTLCSLLSVLSVCGLLSADCSLLSAKDETNSRLQQTR